MHSNGNTVVCFVSVVTLELKRADVQALSEQEFGEIAVDKESASSSSGTFPRRCRS